MEEPRIPFFTRLIATGFFSGYIPWAPGTFGTLAGLLIYLIPGAEQPGPALALLVLGFFVGRKTADTVAQATGHQLSAAAGFLKGRLGQAAPPHPDPSIVVIDEIVGIWIALFLLPKDLPSIILAFTTFRLFDILKPPPASTVEKIGGGWGIMLDDVMAGIYANLVTRLTLWIIS